ncbi:MAG: hypothetical protein AB2L14_27500 [Candidatus Xenobiia bacterium LiM19]
MSKTIKISVCLAALVMILSISSGNACADYGFTAGTKSDYGYEQTAKGDYGYVEATSNTDATNINVNRIPDYQLAGNKDYYFCRHCNCLHHNSYNPNNCYNYYYQQNSQIWRNR